MGDFDSASLVKPVKLATLDAIIKSEFLQFCRVKALPH